MRFIPVAGQCLNTYYCIEKRVIRYQQPCIINGANTMYHQGNSRAVDTWIRDFACKIPGPLQYLMSSHKTRIVASVIL